MPPSTAKPTGPAVLTFGVYGPPAVVSAYTRIAADFTESHPDIVVNVRPFDSHAAAVEAGNKARAAGKPFDLFLIERGDLPALREAKAVRRVDDLLGERQVDFGDGFAREALRQYSEDTALQCMPIELSPLVVYYNSGLIDLSKLALPGESEVTPESGWTLQEFVRAARLAGRHGRRGVYIEPSLTQVAPFLLSGGGTVVDSTTDPKTLTMSDDGTAAAMQRLLEVVRNPRLTYNQRQLSLRSALTRFKDGDLGMMLGFRSLTGKLRTQQGLTFDVMPLPVLGSRVTVSQSKAVCVSPGTDSLPQTADFLADLVSAPAMTRLANTGFVQPTNAEVLSSEAFRQPGPRPYSASVFATQLRFVSELPQGATFTAAARRVMPDLRQLFYRPAIDPLEERLQAMDAESKLILDPESASPTSSPTPSPTDAANE